MTRIIAIANQKGGVGKTTSTINLAHLLADQGKSTLVVDLDPQGNLTRGMGVQIAPEAPTVLEIMMDLNRPTTDAIVQVNPSLAVLPTDIRLAKAEYQLYQTYAPTQILRHKLQGLPHDFILLDCPPSLGILTVNGLTAAHDVLVPVQCQFFALEGFQHLMETVSGIKTLANPDLSLLGILPTMLNKQTTVGRDAISILKQWATELAVPLFDPVPYSIKFSESNLAAQSIEQYANAHNLNYPYIQVVRHLLAVPQLAEVG